MATAERSITQSFRGANQNPTSNPMKRRLGFVAVLGLVHLATISIVSYPVPASLIDGFPTLVWEDGSGGRGGDGTAFCLLIKDDNDILAEWIAYHYHVFRMRRLIVAVDPESETSPLEVVRAWDPTLRAASSGSIPNDFDLSVTLWDDENYVPDFFLEQDHKRIPNSVGKEVTPVESGSKTSSKSDFINLPILRTQ